MGMYRKDDMECLKVAALLAGVELSEAVTAWENGDDGTYGLQCAPARLFKIKDKWFAIAETFIEKKILLLTGADGVGRPVMLDLSDESDGKSYLQGILD